MAGYSTYQYFVILFLLKNTWLQLLLTVRAGEICTATWLFDVNQCSATECLSVKSLVMGVVRI